MDYLRILQSQGYEKTQHYQYDIKASLLLIKKTEPEVSFLMVRERTRRFNRFVTEHFPIDLKNI